jgi:hypothetical protein
VERLTRQCVGLAGVYVLDEETAAKLADSFGHLHAVPDGAVRTYTEARTP